MFAVQKIGILSLAAGTLLSLSAYAQGYQQPSGSYAPQMQQQMPSPQQGFGQQPMPMGQTMQMMHTQLKNEFSALEERVRRVERALIRLDRRMQLIERNELTRMEEGKVSLKSSPSASPKAQYQPVALRQEGRQTQAVTAQQRLAAPVQRRQLVSAGENRRHYPQPVARNLALASSPFARSHGAAEFKPASLAVSQQPQRVTASLQRKPQIPSLADEKKDQVPERESLAIWTVNYQVRKVWPERSELAESGDIVKALRSGKPAALFARGAQPASREFRERVRAISKYLGQVTERDDVPIASMPAEHLDEETIEIIATR